MLVRIITLQLIMGLLLGGLLAIGLAYDASVPRQPPSIPGARDR
jgi:hypothetical protein